MKFIHSVFFTIKNKSYLIFIFQCAIYINIVFLASCNRGAEPSSSQNKTKITNENGLENNQKDTAQNRSKSHEANFWQTFEAVEKLEKPKPKKSIVYIYDPMCEDCTKVRMYAIENEGNQRYMKENFYNMELSIYQERDIQFNNKTWKYKQDIVGRPYHELAQVLNQDENITAPCITFLDENLNMIAPIKKTVTAEELELLLVFVASNAFRQMNVEIFEQQYQKGSYQFEIE